MFSTASSNTISVPSLLSYFHSINATQSALFNCLTYTETATQAVFHLTYVETVAEVVEHSNGQIDHLVTDDRVGQGQGHEERLEAFDLCRRRHAQSRRQVRAEAAADP